MNKRPTSIEIVDEANHAHCRDNVNIKLSYQNGGEALKVDFVWGQEGDRLTILVGRITLDLPASAEAQSP